MEKFKLMSFEENNKLQAEHDEVLELLKKLTQKSEKIIKTWIDAQQKYRNHIQHDTEKFDKDEVALLGNLAITANFANKIFEMFEAFNKDYVHQKAYQKDCQLDIDHTEKMRNMILEEMKKALDNMK